MPRNASVRFVQFAPAAFGVVQGLVEVGLQGVHLVVGKQADAVELCAQFVHLALFQLVLFVDPNRDARKNVGVGQFFEQVGLGVLVGFQERREIVLSQQHRPRKLLIFKPYQRFYLRLNLGFGALQRRPGVDAHGLHLGVHQLFGGALVGALHRPSGLVGLAVHGHKVDLRPAGAAPAPQYGARVVDVNHLVANHVFFGALGRCQARSLAVERQTHRVEQGALARTRGSRDGKEPGRRQRFLPEVDGMRAFERRKVAEADAEYFHG